VPALSKVKLSVKTHYLREELLPHMRIFPPDMDRIPVHANRLNKPVLSEYYRQDWDRW